MNACVLLLVQGLLSQHDANGPREAMLKAVHAAFVANQAAFPFGDVRFTYAIGNAKDATSARRGLLAPQYVADSRYVFDRDKSRYERIFNENDMRETSKYIGNDILSKLDSFRAATDGDRTLYDSISALERSGLSRGVKLSPGRIEFDRAFQFPLSLGQPNHMEKENLGILLQESFRSNPDVRIVGLESDGVAEEEGRSLVKIDFQLKYGASTYWVDLERGSVPVRIESTLSGRGGASSTRSTVYFDDLRQVPERGWLPFKESWWDSRGDSAGQIVIVHAAFDKPPEPSDFALDFPQPISLVDGQKRLRYPPSRRWNIAGPLSSDSRGVEKVQYSTAPNDALPTMPGERKKSLWQRYQLLVLGVTTLAATIALMMLYRRKSS
jgi:hypothetical protein